MSSKIKVEQTKRNPSQSSRPKSSQIARWDECLAAAVIADCGTEAERIVIRRDGIVARERD